MRYLDAARATVAPATRGSRRCSRGPCRRRTHRLREQRQNIVCTGELDQSLNLNALAIGLGLEDTEYEPEQFPGLIFRPSEADCVVLLFATGKVVITGGSDMETADNTFRELKRQIGELSSTG